MNIKQILILMILVSSNFASSMSIPEVEIFERKLFKSVREKDIKLVKEALTLGAGVNYVLNGIGQTALIWAAYEGNADIVKLLLDAKADPNIQDSRKQTALVFAAENFSIDSVEFLLAAKANPNLQDYEDKTALMWVIRYTRNKKGDGIVLALLNAGCDLSITGKNGKTAMDTERGLNRECNYLKIFEEHLDKQKKEVEEHLPSVLAQIVSEYLVDYQSKQKN